MWFPVRGNREIVAGKRYVTAQSAFIPGRPAVRTYENCMCGVVSAIRKYLPRNGLSSLMMFDVNATFRDYPLAFDPYLPSSDGST